MHHPIDLEDPFASRPDEKPPAGWDAGFWEQVRDRIEENRDAGEPRAPIPDPPTGRTAARLATVTVVVAAAVALFAGFQGGASPPEPEHGPTVVRVDGSRDPAVAVEWARSGGEEAGYVVLTSFDPDVSYVLIDRPGRP